MKKSYDKPRQCFKRLRKVCTVKAVVFPIAMYGCENWTMKKAQHKITDALKLVLEKSLESLMDCKEIKPVNL